MTALASALDVIGPDGLRLIEFTVRGSPSTWPDFSPDPRADIAPAGCTISEYLEVLSIFNRRLFVRGPIGCWIGDERAEPNRVILPGDWLMIVRLESPGDEPAPSLA